jgi:hypothetical protein
MAELWEIGQALGSSFDPDGATGRALDILCAVTGTTRNRECNQATESRTARHQLGSIRPSWAERRLSSEQVRVEPRR